ncbi:MAG: tyrosine--tRNA ligase [Planctomycetaceae bacterium]|nr:tyrosine--tRNA ligase [Planctomycetaceae bacterium]
MTTSRLPIYDELKWRGLLHQVTDEEHLARWLHEGSRTLYLGVDPTADSLHIGHFLPVMTLRRFQRAGHRPILLVGGATGMVGDPSGKSEERNLLSVDTLRANVAGMERQMRRLLDFDAASGSARLVNNYDWMSQFGYLEFLRDVGKNFPVNVMLAKDSVKSRLERVDGGLSYTEFSYMLLQAYDFLHLYERYGCELQVGGSDQWGNITAGIDLARRVHGVQLYGLTLPLLTKSDGTKMGKTETGAIWLSADRTSPYAFYQYWINVSDEDAGKCLRLLTELDRAEIESLDAARQAEPHLRQSQRRLAETLTQLIHGDAGLAKAQQATQVFFGAECGDLTDRELLEIFADVPSQEVPRARLEGEGLSLIEALVLAGLAKSNGDARRAIEQGGAYVNNRRRTDLATRLTGADLAGGSVVVLRSGKKRYALLRFAA